jgi:hypothetical protein
MDLFKWSFPFLIDKVIDMVIAINKAAANDALTPNSEREIENMDFKKMLQLEAIKCKPQPTPKEEASRIKYRKLRAKCQAWARFNRILLTLR